MCIRDSSYALNDTVTVTGKTDQVAGAESVQTIMRYEGIPDAYEQLKKLSRGASITKQEYTNFVENLNISKSGKNKLLNLSPASYIGLAKSLANS